MSFRKLRCSFCRKTEDRITKLVAGPRSILGRKVYICDECVAVADSIMQGNTPAAPVIPRRSLLRKIKERWRSLMQRSMAREASAA